MTNSDIHAQLAVFYTKSPRVRAGAVSEDAVNTSIVEFGTSGGTSIGCVSARGLQHKVRVSRCHVVLSAIAAIIAFFIPCA